MGCHRNLSGILRKQRLLAIFSTTILNTIDLLLVTSRDHFLRAKINLWAWAFYESINCQSKSRIFLSKGVFFLFACPPSFWRDKPFNGWPLILSLKKNLFLCFMFRGEGLPHRLPFSVQIDRGKKRTAFSHLQFSYLTGISGGAERRPLHAVG